MNDKTKRYKLGEFERFCPKYSRYGEHRKPQGRNPTLTSQGTHDKETDRWNNFIKSEHVPSTDITRKMVALAVSISIRETLTQHVYQFNNKMYQQSVGGAIGVGLSGEVANLFMVWWDRELRHRLVESDIDPSLYSRYVDDIFNALEGVNTEEPDKDRGTMERVQIIANSIHPSIRLTIDYPSAHSNNRLPVLDTELWIEEIEVDGIKKLQILHSHYMKPM